MGFRGLEKWVRRISLAIEKPRRRIDTSKAGRIEIETLEARILFSADLNPFAQNLTDLSASDAPAAEVRLIDTPKALIQDQTQRELLVIDESVIETQSGLIDSLLHDQQLDNEGRQRLFDIRVIDSARDGLDQLSKITAEGQRWSAVHLISHGSSGSISLGNGFLNSETLESRASQVAALESLFTGNRDLLLYGCDLASNPQGQLFLSRLGALTHSDIAANSEATGNSSERNSDGVDLSTSDNYTGEDADWSLDYNYGQVQTALALSDAMQRQWKGVLATFTVINTNDSGSGSLRQAIISANSGAGADTINFNIPGTGVQSISLLSALPLITGTVNIDGYSQLGSSANTLAMGSNAVLKIELNGASAGTTAHGLNFDSTADNSTVRGLVINRFGGGGINAGGTSGDKVTGLTIAGNFIGTNATGMLASGYGNTADGIGLYDTAGAFIGSALAADRNIISGNGTLPGYKGGINIGVGSSAVVIQGNAIGLSADGITVLGNAQYGILADQGASNVVIGNQDRAYNNQIAGAVTGIEISNSGAFNTTGVQILGNTIWGNSGLAIDLGGNGANGVTPNDAGDADTGPNQLQNFPILTAAYTNNTYGWDGAVYVAGTFAGAANTNYILSFYADPAGDPSGHGDASIFLGSGSFTTDGAGNLSFNAATGTSASMPMIAPGSKITATATNSVTGSTSELATNISAVFGDLVVTNATDTVNGNVSSIASLLATPGGDGISLREAILAANTSQYAGGNLIINFNISGAGVHVISPTSALPAITAGIVINGWTQPGTTPASPMIQIDGILAGGGGVDGITVSTGTGTAYIYGLSITRFSGDGIQLNGAGSLATGNFIGVASNGTAAGNSGYGINIQGNDNWVGNNWGDQGNLISDNDSGGINISGSAITSAHVHGNKIGTNYAGTAVLGTQLDGVNINSGASGVFVGSSEVVYRNIISGHQRDGVQIGGAPGTNNNTILGNYIGTDVTGTIDLGNLQDGIDIYGSANNNQILGNVISGNNGQGIFLGSTFGTSVGNIVQSNYIGTTANGANALGNGADGIRIGDIGSSSTANNSVIGGTLPNQANIIAFNFFDGITVADSTGVSILGNSIYKNGSTAADLAVDLNDNGVTLNDGFDFDSGSNGLQNFPVLSSASVFNNGTLISGNFSSNTNTAYRIEFFSSRPTVADATYGEGHIYLGFVNVSTDGVGNASFSPLLARWINAGDRVSATATVDLGGGTYGSTSEYSQHIAATLASSNVIVVDTISDVADSSSMTSITNLAANRGADGLISLREAITAANANAGTDYIFFNLGQPKVNGAYTISTLSALPSITDTVILDASSEPDFVGQPIVELNGTSAGASSGLTLTSTASGSTVRGFVINRFANSGILVSNSDNNTIQGNYIGTDVTGTMDVNGSTASGAQSGIVLSTGSSGNLVGGTTAAARNVVSGNNWFGVEMVGLGTINNLVQGNYIGTNAAGTAAVGNLVGGISFWDGAANNTIGGGAIGTRNIISATMSGNGVVVGGPSSPLNNIVQGNFIGTDVTGLLNLGNASNGILFTSGNLTLIGGINAGEGNTIAYNGANGISLQSSTGTDNTFLSNNILSNLGLGIDLSENGVTPNDLLDADSGPNNLQNFPLLYAGSVSGGALTLTGEIRSAANKTYRLEFFRTPLGLEDPTGYGEGRNYLAYLNVTTDGSGFAAINIFTSNIWGIVATDRLSATATEIVAGNYRSTSEFSMNIVVSGSNVAPVNSVPGAQMVNEDTLLVISGLSVNDADNNLTTTQLSVNNGVLNINLSGGAILSAGTNGSNSLTVAGTQTQINNALATLSYRGNLNFNGTDSLTVLSSDSNGAGDSDVISITVSPVNDAPVLTLSGTGSVTAGGTYVLNLSATDVDGVTISSWTINWGDSSIQTIAGNPTTATHVYAPATNGFVFNVTASVTDANGQWFQNKLLVPSWSGTDDIHIYAGSTGTFVGVMAPLSDGLNDHIEVIQGPNGHLFVSGLASSNVLEYLPNGTLVRTFISPGAGGLIGPAGMAFGADGKFYVADHNGGTILRYDGTTGAFLDVFVTAGTANLYRPLGLDFGPDGMLYVTSRGDNNILRFNPATGARDITFNGGLASNPESFGFGPDGNIYVPDPAFGRVVRLSGVTGAYMNDFVAAGSGGLAYPTGVAFGPDGNLYVSDQNNAAIRKYNGVTGASLGDYVASGYGGLVNPVYFAFLADHQVAVNNVAPVNTVPGAQTATEDTSFAISGLSVSDANGNLASTRLTVGNGKLLLSLAGGATISAGANNSSTVTIVGAQSQINAALATLTYQGNLNFNGGDVLTVLSTDTTGATDSDNLAITISAVNDAPVLANTVLSVSMTEDAGAPIGAVGSLVSAFTSGLSDPDGVLAQGIAIIASDETNGTWYYSTDNGATWTLIGVVSDTSSMLLADNPSTRLYFVPLANYNGNSLSALTVRAWDQTSGIAGTSSDTTVTGGATAYSLLTDVIDVSITPVNDAPLNATPSTRTVNKDSVLSFTGSSTISVNDLEGNLSTTQVSVSNGTLNVSLAGGATINFGANNSSNFRLAGTQAQINSALASLTYQGTLNFTGTDTLTVLSTDSNSATDSDAITINVTAVNAPVAAPDTYTLNENGSLTASWWNTNWTHRSQILFSGNTFSGATNLTDFPVLIKLNSSNINYSFTQNAGQDLRFFAANGTPLAYQIETWNEAGDSYVWVRVPSVSTTGTDTISMYYGNATALAGQDPSSVWNGNYSAVYHLNNSGISIIDSTSNAITGTAVNGPVSATGQIGTDSQFDGTNDYINLGNNRSFLAGSSAATLSLWVNPNSVSGDQGLIGASINNGGSASDKARFSIKLNGSNVEVSIRADDSTLMKLTTTTNPISIGSWSYISVSVDLASSTVKIFVNGALQAATSSGSMASVAFPNSPSGITSLGSRVDGNKNYFNGQIDEARIATVAQTTAWQKAEYLNMTNAFVSVGAATLAPTSGGILTNDTDNDSPRLTSVLVSGPSNASSFILNVDGTFSYTPLVSFSGVDTFVYHASDGTLNSGDVTVTINVSPVNDAPILSNTALSLTVYEDAGAPIGAVGSLISAFTGGITDIDSGAVKGLAIISNGVTNGTWYYSTDNGGSWLAIGTVNDTSSLLLADNASTRLYFAPNANFNGSSPSALTIRAWDQSSGVAGTKVDSTVRGGITSFSSAIDQVDVFVTPVNDAPNGTNSARTMFENTADSPTQMVFGSSDFGFVDAWDTPANLFAGVFITTLPSSGSLTLSGVNVTSNQFITASDLPAGNLVFTPVLNGNGLNYASFNFRVMDNGGTANGGVESDLASRTLTIHVTPVNTAPVINSNALSISEGGSVVLSNSDINSSDWDNPNSALTISVSGLSHGQFEYVAAPAIAILAFTQTDVDGGLVRFVHDGSQLAPTFSIAVSDGALSVGPQAATVSYAAINNAPLVSYSAGPVTMSEDGSIGFSNAGGNAISLGDLDAGGASMRLTLSTVNGTFNLQSLVGLTFISGANASASMTIQGTLASLNNAIDGLTFAPTANFNGSAAINLSLDDQGNTGVGGPLTANLSIPVTINPVNDAPIATASTTMLAAVLEDSLSPAGATVLSLFGSLFSDAADASNASMNQFSGVAVRAYPQNLSEGVWQYSLDAGSSWAGFGAVSDGAALALGTSNLIRFVPGADYNGSPLGNLSLRLIDNSSAFTSGSLIDVSAFTATSAFSSGLITLSTSVTSVNDAPAGANQTRSIAEYTSGAPSSFTFNVADFGFTDSSDSPANALAGVFISALPTQGSLTLSGLAVSTNQFITNAQLAAGNLVFTPVTNGNGLGYASLSFRVQDNGGMSNGGVDTDLVSRNFNFDVTPVNTAPQMLANSLTISEGASLVLSNAEINTTDFDNPNSALTIIVTGLTNGQFEFVASSGVAITSFTQADIDAGLIRFIHDGSQMAPAYSIAVSDGSLSFGPQAAVINYSAVNSTPNITSALGALSIAEDTSQTFSTAGGNSIVLSDADAGGSQVELTLAAANSNLFLANLTGLSFISGANGSAALVVRGSLTNLNAALDGLVLAPNANFNGSSSLNVSVNDLGNTGSGGAIIASLSIPITVLAVNDAPVAGGIASALAPVLEDALNPAGASVLTLFGGLFTDAADAANPAGNQFAGVAVRAYPQNLAEGAWQYSIDAGANWLYFGSLSDSAALALAPSDLIRFVPTANYNGTPLGNLSLRLLDNSSPLMSGSLIDVSVFNGTVAFSSGVISLSTFVSPVNDSPSITSNGGGGNLGAGVANLSLPENSTSIITTVSASDIDLTANALSYSITGGADAALFSINASTGSLGLNLAALPAGLNFESPIDSDGDGLYLVQVSVSDGVGGFDTQLIRLTIVNLPEAPTAFVGSLLSIAENTDTSVGLTVLASLGSGAATGMLATNPFSVADQDSLDLHTLTILGGADAARFSVIGSPGNYQLLFNAGVLDFEAQGAYQVILRATDPNGLFVDRAFALAILDLNEAPALSPLAVSITENPLAMQLLGSMNFVDQDSGDTFTVRILPPTPGSVDAALLSALSINANGQVFINNPGLFDYESRLAGLTTHSLNLSVEITDSRGLASTATLSISLQDINETPGDLQTALKLIVNQPSEPIAYLIASDQDSSEQFTYALVDNPNQTFKLDAATGAISLSPLGEGLINSGRIETLTVLVTDKGGLQISRTFALKMPSYFAPQATPLSVGGDPSTLSTVTNNGVVIITGTLPATPSAPSTSAVQGKPRPNSIAILTESDLGFPVVGNSADQFDVRVAGRGQKSRPQRFAETLADKANSQIFDIVFATNGVMSPTGSFQGVNPQFESSSDKRALSLLVQSGSSVSKPAISGHLAPAPDLGGDARGESNNLSSLIGKEPIFIASALISAGAVWWAARGLALATAMMMGAPAWRQIDMLPVVLSPSKGFEGDTPEQNGDLDTRLETIATTSFFNAENGDLEEVAIGSLFEIQEGKPT